MKKIFIAALFFTSICFSQTGKFNELNEEGKLTEYISKDGSIFKVDEKILIGYPWNKEYFLFLTQGNNNADSKLSNSILKINKIEVFKLSNGFLKAYIVSKDFGMIPLYIDIESAIETKEITIQ
jgi:hypothetical protein